MRTRAAVLALLQRLSGTSDGPTYDALEAHDAAQRAEIERLKGIIERNKAGYLALQERGRTQDTTIAFLKGQLAGTREQVRDPGFPSTEELLRRFSGKAVD